METLTNTFTFGNISGLNRQLNDETTLYLQHTATINHGSSGSGLFNLKGELIGINTMKIINSSNGYEELNFAIDINTIITCLGEYF
jgi:serine protease Do